jgi:hypothetical protein
MKPNRPTSPRNIFLTPPKTWPLPRPCQGRELQALESSWRQGYTPHHRLRGFPGFVGDPQMGPSAGHLPRVFYQRLGLKLAGGEPTPEKGEIPEQAWTSMNKHEQAWASRHDTVLGIFTLVKQAVMWDIVNPYGI